MTNTHGDNLKQPPVLSPIKVTCRQCQVPGCVQPATHTLTNIPTSSPHASPTRHYCEVHGKATLERKLAEVGK